MGWTRSTIFWAFGFNMRFTLRTYFCCVFRLYCHAGFKALDQADTLSPNLRANLPALFSP